jgi:uncharacterized protein (DUF1697 family)
MSDLRELAEGLGWKDVSTYIQSGNLLFNAQGQSEKLEASLEQAIESATGMKVPVIVRSQSIWSSYASEAPFPEARRDEPNRVIAMFSKSVPASDAVEALVSRAQAGEKIERLSDSIWIHFPGGLGTSKLTPSLIDRAIGSPATGRNFRTVLKLQEMLGQ